MAKKAKEAFRTISEVSEWIDTPTHVLRFWESKFSQIKPIKRAGGRRYYRPKDMRLIGGIKTLLHDEGQTVKAVQALLKDKGIKHVSAMSPSIPDYDKPSEPAKVKKEDVADSQEAEAVEDTDANTDDRAPLSLEDAVIEAAVDDTAEETSPPEPLGLGDPVTDDAPMQLGSPDAEPMQLGEAEKPQPLSLGEPSKPEPLSLGDPAEPLNLGDPSSAPEPLSLGDPSSAPEPLNLGEPSSAPEPLQLGDPKPQEAPLQLTPSEAPLQLTPTEEPMQLGQSEAASDAPLQLDNPEPETAEDKSAEMDDLVASLRAVRNRIKSRIDEI